MDIDAQIREILMRSSPVNDNTVKEKSKQIPAAVGINIIGNQNVVVHTGLFPLLVLLSLIYACCFSAR